MSRRSVTTALRGSRRRRCPAVLLALYFTYSRGGILILVVAAGLLLIVLSRDRLWYLATLAIAALATVPALLAIQSHPGLEEQHHLFAPIEGQGLIALALILLAGIAVALLALLG